MPEPSRPPRLIVPVALTADAAPLAAGLAGSTTRAGEPETPVAPWATLEGDGPALGDVLAATAGETAPIGLVGLSARVGAAPLSWLRRVAGHWLREHPAGPGVVVWPAALPPGAALPAPEASGWRAVTGREAPLRSDAWEGLPGFRYHLLLCAGVRCKAQGADAVAAAIAAELTARRAHDDEVLVTRTLCQFPCNNAPVVSVYPDNLWLRRTTPDDARALLARLLGPADSRGATD